MIGTRTFADLVVPFQCVATDIDQAREVWFSEGPLIEPILASAALPAVLPPVEIDGIRYMDGAVLNDVPVTRAVGLGATHVYVLHTGTFDRPRPEPRRPLDVALQAYWIARRARFQRDLAALPPDVDGHHPADGRGPGRAVQRPAAEPEADRRGLPGLGRSPGRGRIRSR